MCVDLDVPILVSAGDRWDMLARSLFKTVYLIPVLFVMSTLADCLSSLVLFYSSQMAWFASAGTSLLS